MNLKRTLQTILLSVLVVIGVATRILAADSPPATDSLDLLVTDTNAKPVAGALITVNSDGPSSKVTTSPDGHALIPLPKQSPSRLSVLVHADGLVDTVVEWRSPRTDPIPASYTLKLAAGVRITGQIVDDAAQAVAGAHVELWASKKLENPHERVYRTGSLTSNKDGVWSFDGAPADGAVRVGAWDYRFAIGDFYDMKELSPAEIKDGSSKIVLTRGVPVEGVVLKPDGKPLAGARVATGGQMASNRVPPQKTDKDGRFTYAAKPGEQIVLTFTAKGYATELTQFTMGNEKHEVSMQLVPSKPLIGRVIDPEGKPVPNAWIYPDTWRGFRSLEARVRADRDGKFVWKDAPVDEVLCDVDATSAGFIRSQRVAMIAGDQENVVTVQRALRVQGTVVDAATNQPIDSFRVLHGISFSKEQPISWERGQIDQGKAGKFDFDQKWSYPGYAVRIEADGYLPTDSRVFTADEKQVTLELKLKKGESLTAVILTADGKPAVGAKVMLIEAGQGAQIHNGHETSGRDLPEATADANGHCTFPPETGSFKLVALHDDGYAEVVSQDLSKTGEIRLSPWAHVKGKLMIGSKPGENQKVSVQVIDEERADGRQRDRQQDARVYHDINTMTSADGTFTIDRVPPGKIWVGRQFEVGSGRMRWGTMTQTQKLDIAPGQMLEVTLGGKGQPVAGQIVLPDALKTRSDWTWNVGTTAMTKTSFELPPIPDEVKKGPPEAQQKWYADFMKSDAGKAYLKKQSEQQQSMRQYPLEIGKDGAFRIEDVLPGTYQLGVSVVTNTAEDQYGRGDELANGLIEFTVHELPGGRSDDVLTVKELHLTLVPHIQVGEAAPDFATKTIDGKDLKLSDLKGKYVLVDFFYGSMSPRGEGDSLKSATESFASDDRFTMLGVDLSGSAENAKTYSKKSGLSWTAATVNNGGDQNPAQLYGIRSYPSIWLIGPDGKVIARNMRPETIKAALTTAIGPQGL